MKPTWLLSAVLVTAVTASAHADSKACHFQGSWLTTKTKNTDKIDWSVTWDGTAGAGWRISGAFDDRYGHALLDGACDAASCTFAESYKSGKLAGKQYYFTGAISGGAVTGTWGYKADSRADGGTWQAQLGCPASAPAAKAPTQNSTVETMLTGTTWGAQSMEVGGDTYYVVGGCRAVGTETDCDVSVFSKSGKLVKALSAMTPDPMDGSPPVLDNLNQLKVDLDKVLKQTPGSPLVAPKLGADPVTYESLSMKWDAKGKTLSVWNGKKLWKKVAAPAIPKGFTLDSATVYLFEAGSPPAAVLSLDLSQPDGMELRHPAVVFPLPELDGGD